MRAFARALPALLAGLVLVVGPPSPAAEPGPLRAGAFRVDVSPTKFPVLVNGGFLEARATKVADPVMAKALVLDDGQTRLAIVVVDSCMMPRDLLDKAKALAHDRCGLTADRILISATHTHTAPAAMGALGCAPDPAYVELLPGKIADCVAGAVARLAPAEVGWASEVDEEHTHTRRWIRKPGKLVVDPFGQATGRAHMHPGHQNPDAIAPSGPSDPELSVLAVRTPAGAPVALLANYSMHYFGTGPVSADYYGRFASAVARRIGVAEPGSDPFVAMMSQGTSGDQQWMDYGQPASKITIDAYAEAVADVATRAYRKITFRPVAELRMAESTLDLGRRVPDAARLAWARKVVEAMGDRAPKSIPEVYAREAIYLHEQPRRELKLQAIRIGGLGITAIPDEVYALTGLKLKARSPLRPTFNVELANGSEGYIPPPEQHALGGYTTWPARTAALEVQAEPRIVEGVLRLLESVAGEPRRAETGVPTAYSVAVSVARPWAFWRLDEMEGAGAADATGQGHTARLEPGYALYLEGHTPGSRAVHLAGGRLVAPAPADARTVAFWFWNGLPDSDRPMTGVLLDASPAVRVGIGGTSGDGGRIVLEGGPPGQATRAAGTSAVRLKGWHHLALVREGAAWRVYLDGKPEASVSGGGGGSGTLRVGGDEVATRFEGKVDEVAVFDRALTAKEIGDLAAAGR